MKDDGPDDLVFATEAGTSRTRQNVRSRVLSVAVGRANEALARVGKPPLRSGLTNHSLRRTFCAVLYEADATPAYVMSQMGHASASLALEIYTKVMERDRDTGAGMDTLLRGVSMGAMGGGGSETADQSVEANQAESAQSL